MVELIFDFSDFRAGWGVLDKLNVARDKGSDVMNYYMKCNAIGSQYKGTWSLFLPDLRLSHSWQCSLNVADVVIVVGMGHSRVTPGPPRVLVRVQNARGRCEASVLRLSGLWDDVFLMRSTPNWLNFGVFIQLNGFLLPSVVSNQCSSMLPNQKQDSNSLPKHASRDPGVICNNAES